MENIDYSEYFTEKMKEESITYEEYIKVNTTPEETAALNKKIKDYIEDDILQKISQAVKKGYKVGSYEAQLIIAKNEATSINRQRQFDCLFNDSEFIPMLIQDTTSYEACKNWYSEYICQNLDKSINYSEYLVENLDRTVKYADYISEHLDQSINYSEYYRK